MPQHAGESASRCTTRLRRPDRKSTRLNSCHVEISYAVFCLKKKKAGLTIGLHATSYGVTEVYRELGCEFPPYQRLGDAGPRPAVVIMPPTARRAALVDRLGVFKTAALTGWAMDRSLKDRLEVDAIFPLSDHADFEELW